MRPPSAKLRLKKRAPKKGNAAPTVDDLAEATASDELFLWTTFTRMEPAAHIYGREENVARFHVGLEPPVVFDCRMKPWYPDVMEVDDATRDLVDRRWEEYGIRLP